MIHVQLSGEQRVTLDNPLFKNSTNGGSPSRLHASDDDDDEDDDEILNQQVFKIKNIAKITMCRRSNRRLLLATLQTALRKYIETAHDVYKLEDRYKKTKANLKVLKYKENF